MNDKKIEDEWERLKDSSQTFIDINQELTIKLNRKGAVSVHGLGRFPVTLTDQQWEKLLLKKDDILVFIKDNSDKLNIVA